MYTKILVSIFILITIIYIIIGMLLFFNQKTMLYYPNNQDFDKCDGFNEYEKINFNGTRFYFKNNNKDKVIVYYHGNAGSACDRSYFKSIFEKSNASLVFVEYAGYSNDTVRPSKNLILKDAINIKNYIEEKGYKKIIIYGESIGSGPASYHASIGNVNKLILTTPFGKLVDLVQSKYIIYPANILLKEKFDNIKYLQNYEGSLLILHGDNDLVIPNKFSKKLFEKVPSKDKKYILIKNKGHNNIWSSPLFQEKIIENIK
ncbi:alpha/beta hydrolase [Candidatus Vampirococcus lugosii]|uniref:Alpha/beta hydrolase n=2 Tax=Candidatus Vampirococcus lugosii TaxID=2789015 RepID=A0ABS5QLJ2_9BACT|nr:alpha/beta hydrolase [Candidatus Vampirococcus lugosii]